MRWSSVILGAMSLAVLEAVVSTKGGAERAGGVFAMVGGFVRDFVSPAVPALPTSTKKSKAKAKATGATSPIPAPNPQTLQASQHATLA